MIAAMTGAMIALLLVMLVVGLAGLALAVGTLARIIILEYQRWKERSAP